MLKDHEFSLPALRSASMRARLLAATLLMAPALAGHAQAGEIRPGVVVEKVAAHSEGQKAGLQEGDILLTWSRGESQGEIRSPFDVADIETEQEPLGTVTLGGLRNTASQSWNIGPGDWGLVTRPNFSGDLLDGYREGQELARTHKPDEVVQGARRWEELLRRYSNSNVSWLVSWLYSHAAESLKEAQQWKEADAAYQSAVQFASGAGPVVSGQLLRAWAKSYQQRSDLANAEQHFLESITQMEKSGSRKLSIAGNLHQLGRISMDRGNFVQAEQRIREALEIRQTFAPQSLAVAGSIMGLGGLAYSRGDLVLAERYYHEALGIGQTLAPESSAVSTSLIGLGDVERDRGDFIKAEEYLRQALNIEQIVAPEGIEMGDTLSGLGNIYRMHGDLAKSEQYHRRALEISEKLASGSLGMAVNLINIGNIAYTRGDFIGAEQYYLRALDIAQKKAPLSQLCAVSLVDVAILAQSQGDWARAEHYAQRALQVQTKLAQSGPTMTGILGLLSSLASEHREYAKAEGYSRQALAIEEKVAPQSLDVASIYCDLGDNARRQGELAKAENYYRKALVIQETLAPEGQEMANTIEGLGDLARSSGDWENAEKYYRQELAIREKLGPGNLDHAESLASVGAILRYRRQLDAAAQFYAQAVNALENQTARLGGSEDSRSSFRMKHSDIYRNYVDVLLSLKQPDRAFEMLERSRARVLLEMLSAAHLDIRKGADPSLVEQERSLEELLAAKKDSRLRLLGEKNNEKQIIVFTQEIEDLEKQYQDVEERLRVSSPVYAALTQPQALTTGAIQQLLDPDTLLLEYSLGDQHSYLFALTRESLSVHELPKRSEIESKAKHLYAVLTARNRPVRGESTVPREQRIVQSNAEYLRAGSELSQILLGPLDGSLDGKRLVVVGDGALQYVPFSALPSLRTADVPLIAEHEIVELPSASVLAVLRGKQTSRLEASKQLVVLADPVFDAQDGRVQHTVGERKPVVFTRDSAIKEGSARQLTRSLADLKLSRDGDFHLPRLLFTRREADGITALAPSGMAREAVDFNANRKLAISGELANYRIVHFATHALVNNQHPELSGLVLSLVNDKGEPQNGFLDLQDIYNLELRADLVVLSACDTALGKQVEGEGMIGLTRGFMHAGAPRVVASLWNVGDAATAELMMRLYQAMEERGMRPAAALREAQIAMWKQRHWKFPYYWAAFHLHGEWR